MPPRVSTHEGAHVGIAALVLGAAFSLSANGQATRDTTIDNGAAFHMPAAPDSSRPILLTPIVVFARRTPHGDPSWIPPSARSLYQDDGSKLLLGDLRITSVLPASAVLKLYGLPVDQTARDYVWGHRIGGPVTSVFGSRTKVNPDIVSIALHAFLMSHQYRDTNGSLEWRPEFQSNRPQILSLASDLIERRATLSFTRGSPASDQAFHMVTGMRQSDVPPILELAVPALRAIPRYTDSQTYASVRLGPQTIEGFFLFGRESGDWREAINGVEAVVLEDTRQDLAIVRYERQLPGDSKLAGGISWEGGRVESEHRYGELLEGTWSASQIANPRITYSMKDGMLTTWLSQVWVKNVPGDPGWYSCLDGGVESRTTLGQFTVQPSLAFQRFHGEGTIVHGVTLSAHPDHVTLTAGYGTYADYFRFHDGIFGNVFDPGAAQRPQRANHYVASVQYEPDGRWPFDFIRATAVRKDLHVDLYDERDGVRVLAWDCIVAKGGKPSWEMALLLNNARGSAGPVVGMIPISVRLGISSDVGRMFNVAVEANYRSGSVAEIRGPGPRHGERVLLDPSHYVNLALTKRFDVRNRPAHLILTVFNALAVAGSRSELAVDAYGRRHDAPCWANLRLRYDLW